jgi:hypothetical protein
MIQDRLLADTSVIGSLWTNDDFTHENLYADLLLEVGDWISKSSESVYGILRVWLLHS